MATKVTTEDVYVLKDQENNYVGNNSISYDKPTKKYFYSCSESLLNSRYNTYSTELKAQEELDKLSKLATKIKFTMKFHIEKIDYMGVLLKESKMHVSQHPFINKCISVGKEVAIA